METIVYDTKKQDFLHLYDIFDADRIQLLSAKASDYFQKRFPKECDNDRFRTHISAVEDNFDRFVLKKDRMVFYFPQKPCLMRRPRLNAAMTASGMP